MKEYMLRITGTVTIKAENFTDITIPQIIKELEKRMVIEDVKVKK